MKRKPHTAKSRAIKSEIARLVEVRFLRSGHFPEAAILEDAVRIFGGTFGTFCDPRLGSDTPAEVMVECELPGF